MYSGLSNIYKEKMKLPAQIRRLTGTLNGQPITGKNIIANSAKILRQCSEKNEIQIGQVYIGQLNITITNTSVPWRQLKGKEIVLYEGLWIDRSEELEESYWDDVELGHFFISDAPSSVMGYECTCYDAMSKFDKNMGTHNPTGTSKTLYQLIDLACSYCGVTLGMTQNEINNMPNGNETLVVYGEDNDMETYQDLISWCAQTMGANALINRSGQLVFKKYDAISSVVETFTARDRVGNSGKCSNFETFYTGISMVNIEESTTSYYGLNPDNGSVMNLGGNPLLQPYEGQTEQQLETKRRRILTAISDVNYTPFDGIRLNRPCIYDLMDVIELTGGILGDSVDIYGCITKYEWTLLGGMKIQGAGANPALVSAKSKTDKNIIGLKNSEEKTKKYVSGLSETVEQQTIDISGKQNFIDIDILPPSGSGHNGDLIFDEGEGNNNFKRLYRYDENQWDRVDFVDYGSNPPSFGQDGDIYFENDGVNITKIWQKIGGNWYFFEHSGGGDDLLPRIKTGNSLNIDRYVVANNTVTELFQPLYKKRNGASFISNMSITDPLEGGNKPYKISIRFYLNNLLNKWTGLLDGVGISSSGGDQFRGSPWLQISDTNRIYGCIHFANNDTDKADTLLNTALQASKWYRAELEWTGQTDQTMYLRMYDAEDILIEEKSLAARTNYYSAYGMLFQFGGSNNISDYGLNYGTIDRFNTYWTIDGKIKWGRDDMNHEGGAQYIPESGVATPKMATSNFPYGRAFASSQWSGQGPEMAFRQNATNQNFGCSQGAGAYIGFEFDQQIKITKVETWAATWSTQTGLIGRDATKQFKFQGSNDGTNWTDLATCDCQTVTTDQATRHNVFNINNSTAYFYYRLLVTQVQTNNQTAFACINMYE